MNTSKLAAFATLAALVLSTGSAMAYSTPYDPVSQKTQCTIDGGEFSLGDAGSYLCDLPDGSEQACTFYDGADCVVTDGAPKNHSAPPKKFIKFII